jgi:hypothetical protein
MAGSDKFAVDTVAQAPSPLEIFPSLQDMSPVG